MNRFRTEVKIDSPDCLISYGDQILMLGSCFVENIGQRMIDRKFSVDLNPFGILYNPVSIARAIQKLIQPEDYTEKDVFLHQGLWHSFDHHGRFSSMDQEETLNRINTRLVHSSSLLPKTKYLFITFGTARVFQHLESGIVVSNCHQLPAGQFIYELLRVGDIVRTYTRLIQNLLLINPELKVVLTISPVRYIKDGALGNQVSKSSLILAASELAQKFPEVGYFPAYEIFMDDLRDYRYYESDLLHPNQQGVDYTWDKFCRSYFSEKALKLMTRIEAILHAKNHRPRNPASEEQKLFARGQVQKIENLIKEEPGLNLEEYLQYFISLSG